MAYKMDNRKKAASLAIKALEQFPKNPSKRTIAKTIIEEKYQI